MPILRFLLILFMPLGILAQNGLEQADMLIEQGRYREAEALLIRLKEEEPDPQVKDKLGEVYGYQMDWDKAIDIYRELTATYPGNPDYFFKYGGVLAKKAQSSNVFTALSLLSRIKHNFRTALKLNPDHIRAHWAMVDLYVSLPFIAGGNMTKAYQYANRLKELEPLDGYLALGYVYEYDDEPEKAKQYYMKALSILNDLETLERNQLNYQIGKISSEYGVYLDKGITHLNTYIDNYTVMDGVPLEWAYLRLAMIYRKKSEKELALAFIQESLRINPELSPAIAEKSTIEKL